MSKTDTTMRVDREFKKALKDIMVSRISEGKDDVNKPKTTERLTAAIRRHIAFEEIKRDIINDKLD